MNIRWTGLVRRFQSEAADKLSNNRDGVAIVTAHVLMNSSGVPLVWVINSKRVEPSKDAQDILMELISSLD